MLYLYSQLHLHVVRHLRAVHEVLVPWPCLGNPELMTLNELLYLRVQGALSYLYFFSHKLFNLTQPVLIVLVRGHALEYMHASRLERKGFEF